MVKGFKRAEELKFHFIVGTELKLNSGSIILLAKNLNGYKQICRLLSNGFSEGEKTPRFKAQDILEITDKNTFLLLPPRNFISQEDLTQLLTTFSPIQLITKKFHAESDRALRRWLKEIPPSIKTAWTWDPLYHDHTRHELSEIIRSIRLNTPLSKCLPNPNGEAHLKHAEYAEQLGATNAALRETLHIAEACTFSPREIKYFYPQEWLPEGKSSSQFLEQLCRDGLKKRYPQGAPSQVHSQLQHELNLIHKLRFEDYFLTVWEIVAYARSQKILCQGRGSAANSIVCYLLEITSIDPVQMNLLFERFISEERNEAPDIDIDFEHERREEVIQYIYQKYGRHRAGMVATLITYRTKSALRDIQKSLEISSRSTAEQIHRCQRLVDLLKGFPRHLGQHTGGMILTHDRLDEISPIQLASMPGRSVVQWDKYDIETLGLLKIDFLSLGMLTCIRKSFEIIQQTYQRHLELHTIPSDDPQTYGMIQRSETVGVFQIESRAQMAMLPRLKPRNFYDLVIEVGIVRPGPIQGGMVHPYLRRRMGIEKVTYAHPQLKPILEKTLGVPIFQEQVMKMAIEVGGYSGGEADALRRSMGTWKKSGSLEEHSKKLCKRLMQNGVSQEFAERVCQQILGFGEYGFPESHAASFALLTYASAYIKAHYPEVFLCALLNSMPMGFYPFHALTLSFQRDGVIILPVCVNHSQWDHHLQWQEDHQKWALRLGFRCVRGLHKAHAIQFIAQRQKGVMDLFIFNTIERSAIAMTNSIEEKRSAYWQSLMRSKDSLSLGNENIISLPKLDPFENMLLDFKFTETTLETHPVILAKKYRWPFAHPRDRLVLAENLKNLPNGQWIHVFGMVQIIQRPPTANGMCFITLEDETGFLNLVLKPPIYQKFKSTIHGEWILLASGRIQNQSGSLSILVSTIEKTEQKTARVLTHEKPWPITKNLKFNSSLSRNGRS